MKGRELIQRTLMRRVPNWTKEEESFLRNAAGLIQIKKIAEYLGRSSFDVYSKISRMGLKL